ncbi:hypothetical protein HYALB_00004180 [Hymenoscyphus albidus]|uniref:Nephrocystin 3-like N-terminal domain-containing protein n=1 Tax=Hymenoscyphus albidus TaxID=595503 RepID=A0A9N9QE54_9HELO|nr:hypothetical protein HYALB_00004180 [Hymenoscyphus albidus]
MLRFRQMTDRFEEISPAHRSTFDWIFQHEECSWDSFAAFLSSSLEKPYWTYGKMGSGKSTLIKFISDHPNTLLKALLEWAGTEELIIAPFFFWNLGTPLQKSHKGLLRSLLHAVLGKHPGLIKEAFPTIWKDWKDTDVDYDFSLVELKGAFSKLLAAPSNSLKICLIIGLSLSRLKLIISSRPIQSCVSVFEGCPKLRLQDLTKNDINLYIHGNLDTDPNMAHLQRKSPQDALILIEEIKQKADGVFLWVKLTRRQTLDTRITCYRYSF